MTPSIFVDQLLRAITGVNFRFIPCLVLEILGGVVHPPPKKNNLLPEFKRKTCEGLIERYKGQLLLNLIKKRKINKLSLREDKSLRAG